MEVKYTKLPGIRSLHNFLVIRHPVSNNAIMKVRKQCYKDAYTETTMKTVSGHLSTERAIPSCEDTYTQERQGWTNLCW